MIKYLNAEKRVSSKKITIICCSMSVMAQLSAFILRFCSGDERLLDVVNDHRINRITNHFIK